MTVVEYFKEWEGFDYFTGMSDDYMVYLRGQREKIRLRRLTVDNPVLFEIYSGFIKYENSLGESEKPKLEDYV